MNNNLALPVWGFYMTTNNKTSTITSENLNSGDALIDEQTLENDYANDELTPDNNGTNASQKSYHNLKRVVTKSPARSILVGGIALASLTVLTFYTFNSTTDVELAGRDYANLQTIQLNQQRDGRDQLTQAQVEHIQQLEEQKALKAYNNNGTYTPQFADVVVAKDLPQSTELSATTIQFEGQIKMPTADLDYTQAQYSDYSASNGMPAPVISQSKATSANIKNTSQQPTSGQSQNTNIAQTSNSNNPNATKQTNSQNTSDGSGGTGGANDGSGGTGDGGNNLPNDTGIDPTIETLRQSLEDDYNNQQRIKSADEKAYLTDEQRRQAYLQEQINQRYQSTNQAVSDQINQIGQIQGSGTFSTASYMPSTSNQWFNDSSTQSDETTISNVSDVSADSNQTDTPATNTAPKTLPRSVIRAGETWTVYVENDVNTDNGRTVFARVVNGPYAGSRLVGQIVPSAGDRSAAVYFSSLIPVKKNRNVIPIQAVAMTLGNLDTNIATSVDKHYLQRYSALIAQSITGGYAQAYSEPVGRTTEVVNPDGTVTSTTVKEEPTGEQIKNQAIGQLGREMQSEFAVLRARPTTYKIVQGTPLNIMFASNVDTKEATENSIRIYNNTSLYRNGPNTNKK